MGIPFNKPYLTGKETHYIYEAVSSGKISGNGMFTKKCQQFFEERYGFRKTLLTTSCTDALEMAALLLGIQAGDEVIMPSYTFVSTSNAFVLRGAKIVFADSYSNNPNIDPVQIEKLITNKTKAIVVVHYAGIACDMEAVMALSKKHNIYVVEDAAQAIDSYHQGQPLGSIGHLAAFSFHETKNIIAGEGGLLAINDERFVERAEIIWEKGTNRAAFFRGEVDKYGWVDVGSSFLPSEVVAAFLYAQLENLEAIQAQRKHIWEYYNRAFQAITDKVQLPTLPNYATNNGHLYYLVCNDLDTRTALIQHLRAQNIHAVFHYLSLHKSPYYQDKYDGQALPNCDHFSNCLVRLPLFFELTDAQLEKISQAVLDFFGE
ncbi:MAG: dTDP-4-amino-4,6-dideoxygalactose transaminase [Aureispira sp.]|nr:dTDP-4-amino-4,6-dideoxygalactose transaminase [Aureispira sp.]